MGASRMTTPLPSTRYPFLPLSHLLRPLPLLLLLLATPLVYQFIAGTTVQPANADTLAEITSYPPHDGAADIAIDSEGYIYVTGTTYSGDFPVTANAFQPSIGAFGMADAFIAKFSPDGQTLIYSTYFGGSGDDIVRGIVLDMAGNIVIVGQTNSLNLPLQNALQSKLKGSWDAFVTKLSADGASLIYSTYLGGSSTELGRDIAIDGIGSIYLVGDTWSTDFPILNPVQTTNAGDKDIFITKLTPNGNNMVYSTYLGGSEREQGYALAVNQMGDVYVSGETKSLNFPVINAFQPTFHGIRDAFIVRLSATGSTLIYSTYLGGISSDVSYAIAVDNSNHAFIAGHTSSVDFPIVDGFQPVPASSGAEGFIAELPAEGNDLVYSSYLGGNSYDTIQAIALDSNGNIFLTGWTDSPNFPIVNAIQPELSPGNSVDAFVARLDTGGNTLTYSTYLGGDLDDNGLTLVVDGESRAYLAGSSYSLAFPVINAWQINNAGGLDAFISKLTINGTAFEFSTYLGGSSAYPAPTNVSLTANQQPIGIDRWLLYFFSFVTLVFAIIWLINAYLQVKQLRADSRD
jgi:hypothetical protein